MIFGKKVEEVSNKTINKSGLKYRGKEKDFNRIWGNSVGSLLMMNYDDR